MARWKARVEFLLSAIGLLFLSFTVEALQGKRCQDSLLSGGGRSVRAKISGGRGRPRGIFFGFYKTRHILISDSANCTVLHDLVLTQYRRVTDGQTDGRTDRIGITSTALATRALRRAVKITKNSSYKTSASKLNQCLGNRCSSSHTRRPASADRTARATNFRRDLEAT